MLRTLIVGTAIALAATPALAGSGFGSMTTSSSGARADSDRPSIIEAIVGFALMQAHIRTPMTDPAAETTGDAETCDKEKAATAEDKSAAASNQKTASREPVYLAF